MPGIPFYFKDLRQTKHLRIFAIVTFPSLFAASPNELGTLPVRSCGAAAGGAGDTGGAARGVPRSSPGVATRNLVALQRSASRGVQIGATETRSPFCRSDRYGRHGANRPQRGLNERNLRSELLGPLSPGCARDFASRTAGCRQPTDPAAAAGHTRRSPRALIAPPARLSPLRSTLSGTTFGFSKRSRVRLASDDNGPLNDWPQAEPGATTSPSRD
jgi:hypothetical protein